MQDKKVQKKNQNKKAIILAAGKGSRMKSDLIKVAHHVGGKPVVAHVIDALKAIGIQDIILVVGHQAEALKTALNDPHLTYVTQDRQLGTGHAVMVTESAFSGLPDSPVLILAGDCPLIKQSTLDALFEYHINTRSKATVLTTKLENPGSYGRILRDQDGKVLGIREAKDCTEAEYKVNEINSGAYVIQSHDLFRSLQNVTTNNKQGEYYLTDVIHILQKEGHCVEAYCTDDAQEVIGINTRQDLALINQIMFNRTNAFHMTNGVTLIDPSTTYIDSTVQIGSDTVIEPLTLLKGNTRIGNNARIGARSYLNNVRIEDGIEVPVGTVLENTPSNRGVKSESQNGVVSTSGSITSRATSDAMPDSPSELAVPESVSELAPRTIKTGL